MVFLLAGALGSRADQRLASFHLVILAQRVALELVVEQQLAQVRMAGKADAIVKRSDGMYLLEHKTASSIDAR